MSEYHRVSNLSETSPIRVKLPELNLPIFAGDVTEWLSFSHSFQSLIIQNPELSDTQRFIYLKSCLKGSALEDSLRLSKRTIVFRIPLDSLELRNWITTLDCFTNFEFH
uniref:Uncharacterized protein n=1 Tax=Cacopsylla melanoneura TaxID=428564 RepID=A0A8D8WUG5_9HEMI